MTNLNQNLEEGIMKNGLTLLLVVGVAVGMTVLSGQGIAGSETTRPTLNLLTKEVLDTTRQANNKMAEIEQSMSGTFENVKKTNELFQESGCTPESADKGCREIKRQMQDAYLGMLEQFSDAIPGIRKELRSSSRTLGRNLKNKVGNRLSAREVAENLRKGKSGPRVTIPGNTSLAQRIATYVRLISSRNIGSPEVLASKIYIDQQDALYNLDILQTMIQQQTQVLSADMAMGRFNEQSIEDARLIRETIFGGQGEAVITQPPTVPAGAAPGGPEGKAGSPDLQDL